MNFSTNSTAVHCCARPALKQILLVMKLTTLMLIIALVQASAKEGFSQITLHANHAPLATVLQSIKQQTGYVFVTGDIDLNQQQIDVNVKNVSIDKALDACFKNVSLDYKIEDKTVFIKTKEPSFIDKVKEAAKSVFSNIDVTGRILDEQGLAIPSATITVKGTTNATITDAKGFFILRGVDDKSMIVISVIGYEKREFSAKNNLGDIKLVISTTKLDEVHIIPYGESTQRYSVGNIASVSAKEIAEQPVSNVLQALEGRVPGLFITQTNGLNGGGITVRIQGVSSLLAGSDPLYVIDGVPFYSQLPSTGNDALLGYSGSGGYSNTSYGSPFSFLNPNDIESIEVLKDADATSIYGSRAAAGAILIATKKGKAGVTRVDFNLQNGWGTVPKLPDLLNLQQYLQMRREGLRNDNLIASGNPNATAPFKYAPDLMIWDTTRSTNWAKTFIGGTAQNRNMSGSISGGTATMQYLVGITDRHNTTVFPGDFNDQTTSIHFNISSQSANQKFKLQFSGSYLLDNNKLPATDPTSFIMLPPDAPNPYNPDGSLNWSVNSAGSSTWSNPYRNIVSNYTSKTNSLISNAVLSYEIMPGLIAKSNFGYNNVLTNDFKPVPLSYYAPEQLKSALNGASYGTSNVNSWLIEPTLNYHKRIGHGELDFLVGGTVQENNLSSQTVTGSGYPSDQLLQNLSGASTTAVRQTTISQYKYDAVYARLNYRLFDKYIVESSIRRDGSSRFGPANEFNDFWSVGAAWIFSEESIVKKVLPMLSYGKFKASYGTTGNDQIGDYQFLNQFYPISGNSIPYQGLGGLATYSPFNPHLQWEETNKQSYGIDLGFVKDRILLGVVYASNESSNQLINYSLPSTTGVTSLTANFPATIRNTSWEFTLSTFDIKGKDFSWKTNINLTIPKNTLVRFDGLASSGYAFAYKIGQPIALSQLYNFGGVNPQTGISSFIDANGNLTSTPSSTRDRNILVTTFPKWYAGLENSLSYKGFHLDVLFQFTSQIAKNNIFNTVGVPGTFYPTGGNQLTTVLDRWQKPGDITDIQRYSASGSLTNGAGISNAGISDAFFCRLKNASLSWQFPTSWSNKLGMKSFSLSAQGQNLLTLSRFKGLDPETLVIGSLPPLRMMTLGIQAQF